MAEFTRAQLDEIYNDMVRRGAIQSKPITAFGNPKFTAGKSVGLDKEGYIPESLLQASDLISLLGSTYSPMAHTHNGSEITAGTVAEARIDSAIARDAEVAATYLPSASYTAADVLTKLLTVDSNTSGLNADTLDGVQGSGYALASHAMSTHSDVSVNTWIPALAFSGAAVGITYTSRAGIYIKIGRFVLASFEMVLSSKGSSAGNAAVTGLTASDSFRPAATTSFWGPLSWAAMTSALVEAQFQFLNSAGTPAFVLLGATAAAASLASLTNTNFANTTQIRGTVAYVSVS